MADKFKMGVNVPADASVTARLGSAASSAGNLADTELGKFVTLAGDSQYNLSTVGALIEGVISAREPGTQDGWTIGSVQITDRIACICDGLQATAGTGTIAVGDYVRVGTPVAKGTAIAVTSGPKVVKATNQPGAVPGDLTAAGDQAAVAAHAWRVVSVGVAGAVGDSCVIEKV